MKNIIITTIIFFSFSCSTAQEKTKLTSDEFEKKIAELKNEIVLDVRTAGEFSEGHLENALNIDFLKEESFKSSVADLEKDSPVMIYCRSGKRSAAAAEYMREKGFTVYELEEGILDWTSQKKKIISK